MIEGVGIDMIDIERIEKLLKKWGSRFLRRIFTDNEIAYCLEKANQSQCLAARFAAKEALAKALGHGMCQHFSWTDVEVVREHSGKPFFQIEGVTAKLVQNKRVHLSLSHIRTQAAAFVVVESDE